MGVFSQFLERSRASFFSQWTSVSSVVGVICLFCLGLVGCAGGEPKHPTWKNATGAEQYERLIWQSIRDKEWNGLEYHLAPTFVGVTAKGQVLDRAGWVEHWKAAQIRQFSFGEAAVQPNGADMTVTSVLHLDDGPALQVVSVWQQNKRGWTLTATSTTPVLLDPK